MKLNFVKNAKNNVRTRWVEQGIWNTQWDGNCWGLGGRWQHEEAPEQHSEPVSESEADLQMTDTFEPVKMKVPRKERPCVVGEEKRAVHERDTAASRPYYQFLYQVSKEREWLRDELDSGIADVDAQAYQNVKSTWIKWKIWRTSWGDMPGMAWAHEEYKDDTYETSHDLLILSDDEFRQDANEIGRWLENNAVDRNSCEPSSADAFDNSSLSRSPPDSTRVIGSDRVGSIFSAAKEVTSPTREPADWMKMWLLPESADRVLRKPRPSKIEKGSDLSRRSSTSSASLLASEATELAKASHSANGSRPTEEVVPIRATVPPRRSARIKARSGTSKLTIYDTARATAPRRSRRRAKDSQR